MLTSVAWCEAQRKNKRLKSLERVSCKGYATGAPIPTPGHSTSPNRVVGAGGNAVVANGERLPARFDRSRR